MHSTAPQCAELALDRMICLEEVPMQLSLTQYAGCLQEKHPTCHGKDFIQTQCSLDHNVSRWQVST